MKIDPFHQLMATVESQELAQGASNSFFLCTSIVNYKRNKTLHWWRDEAFTECNILSGLG